MTSGRLAPVAPSFPLNVPLNNNNKSNASAKLLNRHNGGILSVFIHLYLTLSEQDGLLRSTTLFGKDVLLCTFFFLLFFAF